MKVEIKESNQKKDFPKLMISNNGTIVLFTSHKEGICLIANKGEFFGEYCKDWKMEKFIDFEGSITLSNY